MTSATNKTPGMGKDSFDDGVIVYGNHSERWQKHGHDRIYPSTADEGYVDIQAGEVVDMKPRMDTGVAEYKLEYNPAEDALDLVTIPEPRFDEQGKNKIATIPTDVIA